LFWIFGLCRSGQRTSQRGAGVHNGNGWIYAKAHRPVSMWV